MKELILDDGSRLLYQLSVKRVKNMNLRVRPDGSVSVSVSRRISQRQAEDFIRSHIDWIRRAQSRSLKRTPVTLPAGLVSGDLLRWQGKEYAARVETAETEAVIVQHEIIVVSRRRPEAVAYDKTDGFTMGKLFLLQGKNNDQSLPLPASDRTGGICHWA